MRFYLDEDKCADVSSQPGSSSGAGDATHGGLALTASYWESGERDPLQPSGRGLWFLCGSTALPSISPRSDGGAVSLPEAGKPGQTPSSPNRLQIALRHPEAALLSHTRRPSSPQSPSHSPPCPASPGHPSRASLLSPKTITPPSFKYSQTPAPPKQASEYSEDVHRYKAALSFVVSSFKWRNQRDCLAGGGGGHAARLRQPPSRLGWFLFLAAAAQAQKTGEENKSIRHKDKYAFQRLHVAADSSGRAVVAA